MTDLFGKNPLCTTLHYTTPHYTQLHYTTLHYTTLVVICRVQGDLQGNFAKTTWPAGITLQPGRPHTYTPTRTNPHTRPHPAAWTLTPKHTLTHQHTPAHPAAQTLTHSNTTVHTHTHRHPPVHTLHIN